MINLVIFSSTFQDFKIVHIFTMHLPQPSSSDTVVETTCCKS